MSSVDDRIVNMQFNNKQFQSGVTQSERSLQGLEKTLAATAKSKGMTGLANSVDQVKTKFSALQVAGVTAVATIANKVTNAGINLVKGLTIDPILQGWEEYNTNLKSIQTTMANTGEPLKKVQGALRQLNTYSDLTIYNFSEMARNVGTFTAAGVKLKTSVAAIQGISNIAALSGSSSQQASSAMYQLSQAIAAGRVNLQDWNSVVNAGMGGKNLQRALITTGIAMGTISKGAVEMGDKIKIAGQSFRESISAAGGKSSWLNSDVLVKTLSLMDGRLSVTAQTAKLMATGQHTLAEATKIATDRVNEQKKALKEKQGFDSKQVEMLTKMANRAYESATVVKTLPQLMGVVKESIGSVWSNAFTAIVGNFNQSKKLWTSAANAISTRVKGFSNTLTSMIVEWKQAGGRLAIIDSFKNGFAAIGRILGSIKGAFTDVFPPTAGKMLGEASKALERFTAALIPSKETAESLRDIFGGVFAVLHIGLTVVKGIASAFSAFFGAIFSGSSDARGGVLSIMGSIGNLLKQVDKWVTSGGVMIDIFKAIGTIAGAALKPVLMFVGLLAKGIAALVSGKGLSTLVDGFSNFKNVFTDVGNTISDTITNLGVPFEKFGSFFDGLASKLSGVSFKNPFEGLGFSGSVGGVDKLTGSLDSIKEKANEAKKSFGSFSGVMDAISDKIKNFSVSGEDVAAVFTSIGSAAGEAASKGLELATGIITGLVKGLSGSIGPVKKSIGDLANQLLETFKSILGIHSPSTEMITIGVHIVEGLIKGIGSAASAVFDVFGKIVDGVMGIFSDMFGNMDSLDWVSVMNAIFTGGLLLSIRNLSGSLSDLLHDMGSTFSGIGEAISNFGESMKKNAQAAVIRALGISLGILAASLLVLSFINVPKLAKGLGAIAIMLGMLAIAMRAFSKVASDDAFDKTKMLSIGAAMLAISTSILLLSASVAILGNMDMETLAKGLGAIAIALGIMVGGLLVLGKFSAVAKGSGLALIMIATAMNILAGAIALLGNMDIMTLVKGIAAISYGLGQFVGALVLLAAEGKGVFTAASSIFMVASAMVVLATAVAAFGNMDLGTLAKGFGAVTIAMALFTGALVILGAMGPTTWAAAASIVSLAGAMVALLPVIITLGSMDMGALAKGIGALAVVLAIFVIAIAALGAAAMVVGPGLIMLGQALALVGLGMLAFGTGFALMAAAGVAGVAVLVAAFQAFMMLLPTFAMQVAASFVTFIETIAAASPRIRKAFSTIFKNILGVVRDAIPEIGALIQTFINTGLSIIAGSVSQWIELGFMIIDEFLKSANRHIPSITESAVSIVTKFMDTLGKQSHNLAEAGAKMILRFLNSIADVVRDRADDVAKAGLNIATSLIDGLTGGLLDRGLDAVRNAAEEIASHLPGWMRKVLGIHSPSRKMIPIGEQIGAGVAVGIIRSARVAVAAVTRMANAVIAEGNRSVARAQRMATAVQHAADRAQAKANASRLAARRLQKSDPKVARKLRKQAEAQQRAADKAQDRADAVAKRVDSAQSFAEADLHGKGDIKNDQAVALADRAHRMLAAAEAEAAQAKKIARTNRAAARKLLAESKKDAKAARALAQQARASHRAANAYYAKEVDARIRQLEADRKADAAAKAAQAKYDAADDKGKAEILNARAAEDAKRAKAANAAAVSLIKQAKRYAKVNAEKSMALLDKAEKQTAIAKEASDQAKQEREQAKQLLGQGTGAASGPTTISISKSVLEDASKAVDRYTASLAAAEEAAGATPQPIQFVQNNTSPVALTPSEVYRQTKNLLSVQELKMGVNS